MINSGIEHPPLTLVRIRPGCQHPTLGMIGGWEGTVLRSFSAEGAVYCDIEVSAKSIAALNAAEKGRFYSAKIVFTRLRVSRDDVQTLPMPPLQLTRGDKMAQSQHEWFKQVGSREQDPTKFVADRAATKHIDTGRRDAIRSLVGFGAFLMVMLALSREDCNCGGSGNGSWGRSGGFSS